MLHILIFCLSLFKCLHKILTKCLSNQVVMGDMALAFLCAFVPFTLGRIILLCMDVVCYASTSSILQVGYGFIL
jgi:hypothetical protein